MRGRRRREGPVCFGGEVERLGCESEDPAAQVLALAEEAGVAGGGDVDGALDPGLRTAGAGDGGVGGVVDGEEDGVERQGGLAGGVQAGLRELHRVGHGEFEVGGRDGEGPGVGQEGLYDGTHLCESVRACPRASIGGEGTERRAKWTEWTEWRREKRHRCTAAPLPPTDVSSNHAASESARCSATERTQEQEH